ncbi:actin-related protein 2/3 complex subunit 3 isoform X2 [Ananas comosus]|uniref:Actin-related protein 2/3 complex subunit 3 isoform X2 n=1 Tax=Ananas comosus TaxID=4615 RepID=A0A6P5GBD0_ANACO|nr:actin-related protein 2/3 complex subunit 3 isoform X2 [Ananas comosus]
MVYHSSFVEEDGITKACGCPLLPLKSHIKGPAPASNPGKIDIVDEAITFFRANVFFRNFDIKSPADKLLIYLTFYINVALKRLEGCRTLAVGTKAIINLGLEKVPVPGDLGFPFPGLFALPQSQDEAAFCSARGTSIYSGITSIEALLRPCMTLRCRSYANSK